MKPQRIRAEYSGLTEIAAGFAAQAAANAQSSEALRDAKGALQTGAWTGPGAAAFFVEMDEVVLPAMDHMTRALQRAADAANELAKLILAAQAEAAQAQPTLAPHVPPAIIAAGAVGAAIALAGEAMTNALADWNANDPGAGPGRNGDDLAAGPLA